MEIGSNVDVGSGNGVGVGSSERSEGVSERNGTVSKPNVAAIATRFYYRNKSFLISKKKFSKQEWRTLWGGESDDVLRKNLLIRTIRSLAAKDGYNFVTSFRAWNGEKYECYYVFTKFFVRPYLDVFPRKGDKQRGTGKYGMESCGNGKLG